MSHRSARVLEMRVNVYSQKLIPEVKLISKESDGRSVTGQPCLVSGQMLLKEQRRALTEYERELWEMAGRPDKMTGFTCPVRDIREEPIVYHAAQLMLHSSSRLHHPPHDDDRSVVTFWLPKSRERREEMARAFEEIAKIFRSASAVGLD